MNKGKASLTNSGVGKRNKPATRSQSQSQSQYVSEHSKLQTQVDDLKNHCEFLRLVVASQNDETDKEKLNIAERDLKKTEKKLALLESTVDANYTAIQGAFSSERALPSDTQINTLSGQELSTEQESAVEQEPIPDPVQDNEEQQASKRKVTWRTEQEDHDMEGKTGVDDLNIEWNIGGQEQSDDLLENIDQAVYGHLVKNSTIRYCIRYGSSEACSSRFESQPPHDSQYDNGKDVTQRSSRIIERIVQFHRDRKEQVPMGLLSQAKVLSIYWDSKSGLGHAADVDVLAPSYPKRRPNTRCYIYLEPRLYAKYKLDNNSGYSHETFSIMKLCVKGIDDWQKCVELHNIAVRLENKFEEYHMREVHGRPAPLCEILDERNSRSSTSRLSSKEPSQISRRNSRQVSQNLPRPTPPPLSRQEKLTEKTTESIQQFHKDFLILFELPEETRFQDLSEEQKILYPSQYKLWKRI